MNESPFNDEPPDYHYSRRQALDDGILIDLTDFSPDHRFVFPVACTAAVYRRYIVPDATLAAQGQTLESRIHHLLATLHAAIRQASSPANRITFTASFVMPKGKHAAPTLISTCTPDDAGDPAITIMLPGED